MLMVTGLVIIPPVMSHVFRVIKPLFV